MALQRYCIVPVMHLDDVSDNGTYGYFKCCVQIDTPLDAHTLLILKRMNAEKDRKEPEDTGIYFIRDVTEIHLFSKRPEDFLLDLYDSVLTHDDFTDDLEDVEDFLSKNRYTISSDGNKTWCVSSNIYNDNTRFDLDTNSRKILSNFSDNTQSVRKMKDAEEFYDYVEYLYKDVNPYIKNRVYSNPLLYKRLIRLFHKDLNFDPIWKNIYSWGNRKDVENYIILSYLNGTVTLNQMSETDYSAVLLWKISEKYDINFYTVINYSCNDKNEYQRRLVRLNKYYHGSIICPDAPASFYTIPLFGFVQYILEQKPSEVCKPVKDMLHKMCHKSSLYKVQMDDAIIGILNKQVDNSLALLLFVENHMQYFKMIIFDPAYGYKKIYEIAVILETAYVMFKDRVKTPRGFIHLIVKLSKYVEKMMPMYKILFANEPDKVQRIEKIFELKHLIVLLR
jgi:hypothetical protein